MKQKHTKKFSLYRNDCFLFSHELNTKPLNNEKKYKLMNWNLQVSFVPTHFFWIHHCKLYTESKSSWKQTKFASQTHNHFRFGFQIFVDFLLPLSDYAEHFCNFCRLLIRWSCTWSQPLFLQTRHAWRVHQGAQVSRRFGSRGKRWCGACCSEPDDHSRTQCARTNRALFKTNCE